METKYSLPLNHIHTHTTAEGAFRSGADGPECVWRLPRSVNEPGGTADCALLLWSHVLNPFLNPVIRLFLNMYWTCVSTCRYMNIYLFVLRWHLVCVCVDSIALKSLKVFQHHSTPTIIPRPMPSRVRFPTNPEECMYNCSRTITILFIY